MKNILVSILFFSISFSPILAQTSDEIKKIKSNNNETAFESLKQIFQKDYESRELAIEFYLERNPKELKSFFKGKTLYKIYDIVDGKPIYLATDNLNAAKGTKTIALHSGGELGLDIEGQNMLIGIWDGGYALKSHVEFFDNQPVPVSRVITPQTPNPNPTTSDHATHVLGTLIAKGEDPDAKGMAPKARAVSYTWDNDETTVLSQITSNGLLISNHSYGVSVLNDTGTAISSWIMGCYSNAARNWDLLSYNAPYYLRVASAGNSGSDSYTGGLAAGYDKLTTDKTAKNSLIVANANPTLNSTTGAITILGINSSSSQGPTDDGRIKPDIAGDGTNLYSSINTNSTSYATYSGTSMASPNVAGSLLLLQQYYNQLKSNYMRAATLKGLVCHTAKDDNIKIGPDPKFGWGLLDTKKAAELIQMSSNPIPTAVISENILNEGQTYTFNVTVSNTQKLEATISWTDPAGDAMDNSLNSPNPVLINDLDLRIKKATEVFYPYKLQLSNLSAAAITGDNIVDNIEKVVVPNPSGTYTIEVTHKGTTLTNSSQAYSLIISGSDMVLDTKKYNTLKATIWPNPINNILNITLDNQFNDSFKAEFFDIQGRLILSKEFAASDLASNYSVEMIGIPPGIYILKATQGNNTFISKIIKK